MLSLTKFSDETALSRDTVLSLDTPNKILLYAFFFVIYMAGKTNVNADLYSVGRTATIITDRFAFQARNDACVKVVDGRLMATKFGLQRTGPGAVKNTRERVEEAENADENYYDRINENVRLELYDADNYYIPTTLDRIFADHNDYAVYDKETSQIYRVSFDQQEQGMYNLIGINVSTIQKVDTDSLSSNLRSRYIPLIKIEE